jgi:hypothetical protein
MATAELTPPPQVQEGAPTVRAACVLSYAGMWALTGLAAAAVHAGGTAAGAAVRGALRLQLWRGGIDAHPLANIAMLAAHNLPIAAWPLLLGLAGADMSPAGGMAHPATAEAREVGAPAVARGDHGMCAGSCRDRDAGGAVALDPPTH